MLLDDLVGRYSSFNDVSLCLFQLLLVYQSTCVLFIPCFLKYEENAPPSCTQSVIIEISVCGLFKVVQTHKCLSIGKQAHPKYGKILVTWHSTCASCKCVALSVGFGSESRKRKAS